MEHSTLRLSRMLKKLMGMKAGYGRCVCECATHNGCVVFFKFKIGVVLCTVTFGALFISSTFICIFLFVLLLWGNKSRMEKMEKKIQNTKWKAGSKGPRWIVSVVRQHN